MFCTWTFINQGRHGKQKSMISKKQKMKWVGGWQKLRALGFESSMGDDLRYHQRLLFVPSKTGVSTVIESLEIGKNFQ